MARKRGNKGGQRVAGRPDASPPLPCTPETLDVHLLFWASGWSEGRCHITLLREHSFTSEINSWHHENDCIITRQLCYLTVSARLSPKDRMKGVREKSHTPFYPSSTLEIKAEYATAFQKKIILSALWGPNTPWGTLLTPEHTKLSIYTGIYWGPVAQGWGAGEQGCFGSSHKMVLYYLVLLFPPHTH